MSPRSISGPSPARQHLARLFLLVWLLLVCAATTAPGCLAQQGADNPEEKYSLDREHAAALKSAQNSLTILDASSNINEQSLECDAGEVRGTLRDSSAGLPGQLAVGSLIAASNLRCGAGASMDHMLRVVKSVQSREGSAQFVIATYDVASPAGNCSADAEISVGEVRLCIRQEQLPYVRLISSSSKESGYTHTIYISAAADLLQQLAIPGFTTDEVYIAYATSDSADDLPEAQCGLLSYSGNQHKVDDHTGSVLLSAPFSFCAKTCSDNVLLQGSPCLRISFRETVVVDEEALANAKIQESSSPFKFVKDGSDPMLDGAAEKAAAEMRSYRLSRSMAGLIAGVCVSAVVIMVAAFVAVRCANGRHRKWLANYFSSMNRTAPGATEDGMVDSFVTQQNNSLMGSLPAAVYPQVRPRVHEFPPMPVAPKSLPPLRSVHSSTSPMAPPPAFLSYTYFPDDTNQQPVSPGIYYSQFSPARYTHVAPTKDVI